MMHRALRDERLEPLQSARRLLYRLTVLVLQCIFAEGVAADERDPFLALATHAEGIVNYVRASEVQALVDLNQSKCLLVLLSGEEMRAYQKCASIAGDPKQYGFVSFTSPFGNVFAIPAAISSLRSTSSSGCSLALRNARFVPVSESCVAAHKALVGE